MQTPQSSRTLRLTVALAFVLGLGASSTAQAYHYFEASTGGCKWTSIGPGNVDFLVDKSSTDAIGDDLLGEVTTARDRWNDVTSAQNVLGDFTKSAADFTDANFGTAWGIGFAASGPAATPDGQNEVVLDETGDIFRNTYGLDPDDINGFGPSKRVVSGGMCTITDAFNLLNGTRTDFDRQSTTVHEFGHIQGLAHSSVGEFNSRNNSAFSGGFGSPSAALDVVSINSVPTMHPFSSGTGSNRQTPEQDDVAGLSQLYPEAAFATDNGVITGTVTKCTDDSPLEGVNVRAVSTTNSAVQVTRYTAFDSNGEGRYRIEGLPPGNYRVVVEPMGFNGFTKTRMAIETRADNGFGTEYYGPTAEAENACSEPSPDTALNVAVAAGATTANIDVKVGGVDLVFVVDDTGSMSREISAVADILNDFVDILEASAEEFPKVAIITYKDNVTFRVASNVPDELRVVINALRASGGGDCPESANAALIAAGRILRAGGVSLLFTDADSRPDGPTRALIQDYYRSRSLTLSVLLSATCSRSFRSSTGEGAAARFDEGAQCTPEHSYQECRGLTALPEPGAEDEFAEPEQLGFEDAVETFAGIAAETGGIFKAVPRPTAGTDARDEYVNFGVNLSVSSVLPAVGSVSPGDAPQGATLDAVIVGSNTNWGGASTVVFEPGVTVTSTTVNSPTQITVELDVSDTAALGFYDVTVTTPLGGGETEEATGVGAFQVRAPAGSEVISVVPGTGSADEILDVDVRGFGTNFDNTSTVDFGSDITVNSVTFESAESLSVNVTIATDAFVGFRTVTVSTGAEFVTQADAFLVTSLPPEIPRIGNIIPSSAGRGDSVNVTVTGQNTSFDDSDSELTFSGTGLVVTSTSVTSPTELTATVQVASDAPLGFRDVQVETGDESAVLLNGFQVLDSGAAPPPSAVVLALPADGRLLNCVSPGGTVFYQLNVPNPFARLAFSLRGKPDGDRGRMLARVSLVPPDGDSQPLGRAKQLGETLKGKKVPLLMAGDYFLRISDASGDGGCFAGRVDLGPLGEGRGKARLKGCVREAAESSVAFDAEAGQKLSAKIRDDGLRRPEVTLVSPSGARVEFKGGKNRVKVKGFDIDETGRWRLLVRGASGRAGCFKSKLRLK